MPDRTPASSITALKNALAIAREDGSKGSANAQNVTRALRQELADKGLKGFKRGGKVKKTGVAKVHKGERVLTAKQAKKPAVKKALAKRAAKPTPRRR